MRSIEPFKNTIESIVRKYDAKHWYDARQECYLKFYELGNKYEHLTYEQYFSAMAKSMYNSVRDYIMREKINHYTSSSEVVFSNDEYEVTIEDIIADPSCLMSEIENKDAVNALGLSKIDREILWSYYVEGYTPKEIAERNPSLGLGWRQIYNIICKHK